MIHHAILVIGPPGAGKDTVCDHLWNKKKFRVISTHRLLKEAGQNGFIEQGNLAPDDVMCKLLTEELSSGVEGVVVINTLRSRKQCNTVWQILTEMNVTISTLHLRVENGVAISRMGGRGRNDDSLAESRLGDYQKYGPSVLDWLKTSTDFVDVNANREMDEVLDAVERCVDITLSTLQPLVRYICPHQQSVQV